MEKRGVSHVEFILSFLLFIGFLLSILLFFDPFDNNDILDVSLNEVSDSIIKQVSKEIISYSVVVDQAVTEQIIKFTILNINSNYNVSVEDYNGNVLPSLFEDTEVVVDRGENSFLKVKFSDAFEPYVSAPVPPSESTTPTPTIASSNIKNIATESGFNDLKTQYVTDYSTLKTELGLPPGINFAFEVKFDDINTPIIASNSIPSGVDVFVDRDRIEIIRGDGKSEFADLSVKVW